MSYENDDLSRRKNKYTLVKYDDSYKNTLVSLGINNEDFDSLNCQQIFMVVRTIYGNIKTIVGSIYIIPSTDESKIRIYVQLKDGCFESKKEMIDAIDKIVDSLKILFYNKKYLELHLSNNIDLFVFNSIKYDKRRNNTYVCENGLNNILISALVDEMCEAETILTNWGESWVQKVGNGDIRSDSTSYDITSSDVYDNEASLPELFSKFDTISWLDIDSLKASRSIIFSRNGNVEFFKEPKGFKKSNSGINYRIAYNVLYRGFELETFKDFCNHKLQVGNSSYFNEISCNGLNIIYENGNKRKKIIGPIIDGSSIFIELCFNENGDIDSCLIEFRTHKSNGKINGKYLLRLKPYSQLNKFSINFIRRSGYKSANLSKLIEQNDIELYTSIMKGNITLELIDELIKKVIPLINEFASCYQKQPVSEKNEEIMKDAVNLVKSIIGEIPLPHLKENLIAFVDDNDRGKKDGNPRLLKKQ